jgi:tRNA-2-methylthio-N6-dimethylallyladenosine synthase
LDSPVNEPGNSVDKRIYVETYGCQMNAADTEIVYGIMNKNGFPKTDKIQQADIILLNTCSIREHAEARIYQRLNELKNLKRSNPSRIIGVIGCMAERLKHDLMDKTGIVDLIVGPDEYRKIPALIDNLIDTGEKGIAVRLSRVETYDDITPVRKEGITAWISVMRGCDKFCSFCVVPFTRGRERSRNIISIVNEVKQLWNEGFREVTLLGQNVNSYCSNGYDFSDLLSGCAVAAPEMRIRFTTSHPQDLSVKLIQTIASHKNICKYIHLPLQSGSNRILDLMKRNYSVEHYMDIIQMTRRYIPEVSFSTDIIAGFPTETDADHRMTLDIMKEIRYDGAFMFRYSAREHTKAYEMKDSVDEETKTHRLMEIIELQRSVSEELNKNMEGNKYEILVESLSRKSDNMLMGRTDGNKSVIIPKNGTTIGEKVMVKIVNSNSATLFGELVDR